MRTRFYTHYQVKCVIDDPFIKNGFYGAPTAVCVFCQKDFAFNAEGGQGREASTNPSGYDGSPIFDLYSSIRSSEQSMPAASKTIFSVSIFT